MKTALSLVVYYVLVGIFGTAFCGFLFMICEGLNYFIVGQPLNVFSLELFTHGICYSIPGVFILVQLFLVLFILRKRNKYKKIDYVCSIFVYAILGIVTWCFIFPQVISFSYNQRNMNKVHVSNKVSVGYFREIGEGVYYYSKIHEDDSADGIFIYSKGTHGENGSVTPISNRNTKVVSSPPFADVLVRMALYPPEIVSYPIKVYSKMLEVAKKSWSGGKFAWLSFATLGLVFISLYGVQFFSSWKLIDAVFILIFGAGIVLLNFLFYSEQISLFISKVQDKLPINLPFDNSIIVYLNLLISVFFFVFGGILGIYRIRKANNVKF